MPTPPFDPAAFGNAAPPPPPAPPQVTDESLLALIRTKVTFGAEPVQNEDQAQWSLGLLKQRVPDLDQLNGMLTNSSTIDVKPLWEEDQKQQSAAPVDQPPEQRLNPAVTTPPPNPISDSTDPQIAQPPPADAPPAPGTAAAGPEQEADPAAWDRISGTQCKSLRGLKSRLSKTHKVDWKDYCLRFNLSQDTGLELGAQQAPPAPPAGSEIPATPAPASPGIPLQPSATGTRQASLPPAPESPQFGAANAEQPSAFQRLPSIAYIGSPSADTDYAGYAKQGIQQLCVWSGGDPIQPEEVEEAYDWLVGAFTGIDGVRTGMQPFQIYTWLADLHGKGQKGELSPLAPAKRQPNLASEQFQQPTVPMFAPPTAPATPPSQPAQTQPAPAAPEQLALDLVSAAAQGQYGQEVQGLAQNMLQPHAQPAEQQPQPQHTAGMGIYSSRQDLAVALGGPVDCVFVPLLDAATFDLSGRVDANQLAGQCELEALQIVTDPQELKFRRDRQVAEHIFMKKLTETPKLYVLIQGYDWVLPENLVP